MDRARVRGASIVLGVAALAFLLDRVSKIWAEHTLQGDPIQLIPGILSLRFTTNSGGAFSLGQSAPWFFAAASIGVASVIVVAALRRPSPVVAVGLGLVLGGALGNLTDRAARGHALNGTVIDFIDFHVWPVFNLADAAIVTGAALLVWASWRSDRATDDPIASSREPDARHPDEGPQDA